MTHNSCSQGDTLGWAGSQRQKHVNVFAIIGFSRRAGGLMGNRQTPGWAACPVIWSWSERKMNKQSWRMRCSLESLVLSWVLGIWVVGCDSKLDHNDASRQANTWKKKTNPNRTNKQNTQVGRWTFSTLSNAEQHRLDMATHLRFFLGDSWRRRWILEAKTHQPNCLMLHYNILFSMHSANWSLSEHNDRSFARQVHLPLWSSDAGSYAICKIVLLLIE